MHLQSLFGGSARLAPRWSFSTEHVLWRFLVSEHDVLVGEDRDTEAKSVTFFALALETGKVIWRGRSFGDPWWSGIEAIVGDRLFLHGFLQPDMPEHRGVRAIDATRGEEAWSNPDISFYAADDARVIGFRDLFERRVFEAFDAHTGVFLCELASVDASVHELRGRAIGRTDFLYPEPLADHDPAKELIGRALAADSIFAAQAGPPIIEAARAHGRIIASAHLSNARTHALVHRLTIIDEDTGKELYRDTLNAATPYPVSDSFFIDRERVIYIKEKQTLVSLPLV